MDTREHAPWVVVCTLVLLLVGIAGCDRQAANTGTATVASATTAVPTRPVHPTATLTPVVLAPVCVTPAPTSGWAVYSDSQGGFRVPLPPGWRAGSFTEPTANGPAVYLVQFFPPGDEPTPGPGAAAREAELITISVSFAPPYVPLEQLGTPEAQPVALGNTHTTVYDRMGFYRSELLRFAAMTQGTVQFTFELHELNSQSTIPLDLARIDNLTGLYLGMLAGFQTLN